MRTRTAVRVVAAVLSAALLPALSASAEQYVRCESQDYHHRYCRAETDNRAELVRQFSKTRCVLGQSWGYDRRGVWVDRGCAAEFRVGRGVGRGHDNSYRGDAGRPVRPGEAIAAGAAITGLVVAASIAANRDRQRDEVPSWAVGTFTGFDSAENTDVELTINPGGSVDGIVGRHRFTGNFAGNRLEAGRQRFRVERSGNGFLATDENDSSHRVSYRRSGGY